jgi:hypothetical protein
METRVNALKYLLAVGATMLLTSWPMIASAFISGCDDWGCGSNHNETLVRDPR